MSFSKAVDLVKLAQMAAGRHAGISLSEVAEEFSCSYRTAQRMTRALEMAFPVVSTRIDDQQRKHWHMNQYDIRLLAAEGLRDTELVALEMSIRRAIREGVTNEAEALRRLRDRFLAALSRPAAPWSSCATVTKTMRPVFPVFSETAVISERRWSVSPMTSGASDLVTLAALAAAGVVQ
jgi:predicted DNA-binding transcriptional regulator YafY